MSFEIWRFLLDIRMRSRIGKIFHFREFFAFAFAKIRLIFHLNKTSSYFFWIFYLTSQPWPLWWCWEAETAILAWTNQGYNGLVLSHGAPSPKDLLAGYLYRRLTLLSVVKPSLRPAAVSLRVEIDGGDTLHVKALHIYPETCQMSRSTGSCSSQAANSPADNTIMIIKDKFFMFLLY